MSKKGLSIEEKKTRMLQLFHERREFFQLKELERIAPKDKGITVNSVKEVIQALVDDGSVDTDKIGGSVYYWSFPSKLVNTKKRKLEELQTHVETSTKRLKLINGSLGKMQDIKESTSDLDAIVKEVEQLQQEKMKLENKLALICKNPDLEKMQKEMVPVKEAANRWTDNIFAVKSWCKKKFMIEDNVLNKQFGIPEDLDYIA